MKVLVHYDPVENKIIARSSAAGKEGKRRFAEWKRKGYDLKTELEWEIDLKRKLISIGYVVRPAHWLTLGEL